MTMETLPTKYCIIGAGPAGLAAARAFLRYEIEVDIIERNETVGGIWDIDAPGSPMYESCSMITSGIAGGFVGYPMPEDYPMYPRWYHLLEYVKSFADEYGLTGRCTFGTSVTHAEPVRTGLGTYWEVHLSNGETRHYRGVVAAIGSQWTPFVPAIEGLETFTGRAIHSSQYRSTEEFKGKRVLVVGAGNSGVDVAVDAALNGTAAFLSTRRPYHFFPKQIFGLALPDLLDGRGELPDVPSLKGIDPAGLFELILATVGDLSQYGLPKPDAPVGSTHPIVSNTVLHAFSHGLLKHRNDLTRIEGSNAVFADGAVEEVDVIVFATGYHVAFDWLPEGLIEYKHGHPQLQIETFAPGVEGLYVAGAMAASVGAAWTMFDIYANLAAADAHATLTGANAENLRRLKEDYTADLDGGFPFLDTPRNSHHHEAGRVMRGVPEEIRTQFGIALPRGFDDEEFYAGVPRLSKLPVGQAV